MAEEIDLEKCNFRNSRSPSPWPWPWSGHTAYHRASLIDHYLHTKFHWNRKKKLFVDGRTDVRTYWQTFQTPSNVIMSTRRSRPKNRVKQRLGRNFRCGNNFGCVRSPCDTTFKDSISGNAALEIGPSHEQYTTIVSCHDLSHAAPSVPITTSSFNRLLWSPYVIGQTIIFLPCDFYLCFFVSSSFPRLISAAVYWMSTILPHMVWP